jgi:hypothetical protein
MIRGTDRYVRISVPALQQIRLNHVFSDLDQSITTPTLPANQGLTGYTEWAGEWDGTPVSVGWDWAVVRGSIMLVNPMEIRTNIRILSPNGDIESSMRTRIQLQEWIEGLSWRAPIEEILAHR